MPISKGEPWGERGLLPDVVHACRDDAEVASTVFSYRERKETPVLTVAAGDLLRTVGGTEHVAQEPVGAGGEALLLPIDLCLVTLDDRPPLPFVAHLVARHRWWRHEGAVAMNAAWLGAWYLGPRAHPNDGIIDTTVGELPVRQRWEAKRRAPLGTHLPHPALTTGRGRTWSHEFERVTPVVLDGRSAGAARRLSVEVVVDAFTLALDT